MQTNCEMLSVEKKEHVAIISVPDLINEHGPRAGLFDELTELCAEIETDQEIRVVVVSTSGEGYLCG